MKSDFNRLRNSGRKMSSCRWLTIIFVPNTAGYLRYGFSIPRQVGSAVIRNRLRRWSREIIRNQVRQIEDLSIDVHFIFRPQKGEHYKNLQLDQLREQWKPKAFPTDDAK